MPIGNAGIHIQIYVSELILNFSFIYWFFDFNLAAIWNDGETLIFKVSKIQICQIEKSVFHKEIYVSYFILKLTFMYGFCEFKLVASWITG
jgi:hypothetical protein